MILLLLALALLAPLTPPLAAQPRSVLPVLSFPEPGVDDTSAYRGYRTRFFRDSRGNALQVYLDAQSGRVVHLWADAANESLAFSVRDSAGRPATLEWAADGATVADSGGARVVTYRLSAGSSPVRIGWFLLGSMRVERDFQYARRHLEPFSGPAFRQPELEELIGSIETLPAVERRRHLELLGARSVQELRARLQPALAWTRTDTSQLLRVEQPTLDGRNRLVLAIGVDTQEAVMAADGRAVSIRSRSGSPVRLTVTVATDARPLTPLARDEIFTADFLRYVAGARAAHDSVSRLGAARPSARDSAIIARARWLERQVRSVELLSSQEKLMAGLPNYATYFGRDMMMSALMMQPIWTPAMAEHVISSVLGKLSPSGQVSHEEALGGQAIRENAATYARLVRDYLRMARAGESAHARGLLDSARAVLGDLQSVRENYHMLDDEFQLPVLAARYLGDPRIPAQRKRAFLSGSMADGTPRLALLVRELGLVATMAEPYAREPLAGNLVGFPMRDSAHWFPGSWRDSNAGYANGRFAMDINAIWVPRALTAIAEILAAVEELGIGSDPLHRASPEIAGTPLDRYARDRESLRRAIATWNGASRHFTVSLSPAEIGSRSRAWLGSLPVEERRYWETLLGRTDARDSLVFLALSLDAQARPIPVVNTDPATALFLTDFTTPVLRGSARPEFVLRTIDAFTRAYPVGLSIDRLGPVVANDTYAGPSVWEAFRRDLYHSPRVVWGREVNLFLLGLLRQLAAAGDATSGPREPALESYVQALDDALRRTLDAVEASGFKHAELWSYRIEDGRLLPVRYGTGSDLQLWSTTDLAVRYELWRLGREWYSERGGR